MNTQAAPGIQARVCSGCGYDLSGGAGLAEKCPECGAVWREWEGRWRLGVVHLGLTLVVWGAAGCAAVWSLLIAGERMSMSTFSVRGQGPAAMYVPAVVICAGVALLAVGSPRNVRVRRWAIGTVALAVLMAAVLVAETSAESSGFSLEGPGWLLLPSVHFEAGWGFTGLGLVAVGFLCALAAEAARGAGMERVGARLRAMRWVAPVIAAGAIAACTAFEWKVDSLRTGGPIGANGRPAPAALEWYWTNGVQLVRIALYAGLGTAGFGLWVVLLAIRVRIGDVMRSPRSG